MSFFKKLFNWAKSEVVKCPHCGKWKKKKDLPKHRIKCKKEQKRARKKAKRERRKRRFR